MVSIRIPALFVEIRHMVIKLQPFKILASPLPVCERHWAASQQLLRWQHCSEAQCRHSFFS